MPYKDPEKNREAAKLAMRRARAQLRATKDVLGLISDAPIALQDDSLATATSVLASLMIKEGLTPQRIIGKVLQQMEAVTVKSIDGERIEVADNGSQLKATEIAINLGARAGLLPSDRSNNSSGNINLQIISFNSGESEPQVEMIDAPVIES